MDGIDKSNIHSCMIFYNLLEIFSVWDRTSAKTLWVLYILLLNFIIVGIIHA